MNALIAAAFADELEKISAIPMSLMGRAGKAVWGSGAGRAAIGAVPGAAIGYATAPEEQRIRNALIGGAAGAAGGMASPLATKAGRQSAKDALKRWQAAQRHQFTGRGSMPIKPGTSAKEVEEIVKAEKAGLTSIPGMAKGLATRPLETLKSGWRHADRMGKAMAGVDVALGAKDIADPTTQAGVGEKALGTIGSAGGYLMASRMGLVPSMLAGGGIGKLTGMAGRGIDVLTGERGRKLKRRTKKRTAEAIELSGRPSTQYLTGRALRAIPEQARQALPGGIA